MNPEKEEWRKVADQLLRKLATVPHNQQLSEMQKALDKLPPDMRTAVETFTFIALKIGKDENSIVVQKNRNRHISGVVVLCFVVSIVMILMGVYLVGIAGDDADTTISIMGSTIGTNSLGIGCFGIAGLLFLYIGTKAIGKY